eukprot:scaffold527004_cov19-Prasinocladus_malaysianus.AAC.1
MPSCESLLSLRGQAFSDMAHTATLACQENIDIETKTPASNWTNSGPEYFVPIYMGNHLMI